MFYGPFTIEQVKRRADKHQARRLYAASTMPELRGELDEARYKAASYAAPGPQQNFLLEAYFLAEAGMILTAMHGIHPPGALWEPSFDKMEPDGPGR